MPLFSNSAWNPCVVSFPFSFPSVAVLTPPRRGRFARHAARGGLPRDAPLPDPKQEAAH